MQTLFLFIKVATKPDSGRLASEPEACPTIAVSSSSRPWMDVFALPEKSKMAVTETSEGDPDPKARKTLMTVCLFVC